jgi:4-amino-4-deoxy-L-arabinose transferase-like glycosyltransferase
VLSSGVPPAMKPESRALLLLFVAGLLARLAFLVLEPATHPVADERVWIGWSIEPPDGIASPGVAFNPWRTRIIFHPPVFPYLVGAVYTAFGGLGAVKVMQALAGALLVPAVGRIGSKAFGPRAGLLAAALAAFYPELVWYSVHFWSEPVFLALLWWGIERILAADEGLGRAAAAGALWGLAVLTRETALYFVPIAALWLAWRSPGGLRRAAVYALATLLVVAPWAYRNWVLFRAFVPVSTMGGLNLWQGNGGLSREELYARYEAVQGRIPQFEYARRMGMEAILRRQPTWFFEKVYEQAPHFWEIDSLAVLHIHRGAYGPVRPALAVAAALVVILPYLAVMALFVPGLARFRPDRPRLLLMAFLIYYLLLHVASYGYSRFRVPILPILFLVAAWYVAGRRDRSLAPWTPARRAFAVVLGLGLALSMIPSVRRNLGYPAYGLGGSAAAPDEETGPVSR